MQDVTATWLQSIDALKEVPADQLQWMIDQSRHYILQPGDFLFKTGDPITGTHIIITGMIRIHQRKEEFARIGSKSISGYLPFSRGKVAPVFGEALEETQVMSFPIEKTQDLIRMHFELTQALVHFMTTRVREFTSMQLQNEKMLALGKLSAGLAHELNNPASAVVRGAVTLKKHLQLEPESFKKIISIRMDEADVDIVNNKMFEVIRQPEKPRLSLMERSEKEDELVEWLDEQAVENSMELAENFVEFGFTIDHLNEFKAHIPPPYISPIFNWINANLVTEKMVTDIEEASNRIATLVKSVKTFTHMDQGRDKQLTDIRTGIENTLAIMQHKLRKGNIAVELHFDDSLPQIKALIGELNQVWTNLIDNAVDAMEGVSGAKLEIRTEPDNACIKVIVTDNGPGIPPEIINRIFDPFFTTKEIGKGTGLGLDIASQIVRQHHGNIKVQSEPGRTQFFVSLPING